MLKKSLTKILLLSACFSLSAYSLANDKLKTSSLSMMRISSNQKLPNSCQKMFKEADKLISDAEKQPGTHIQVSDMKDKLSRSKQQILKMHSAMQEKSCDKGLIALNQLKQKY